MVACDEVVLSADHIGEQGNVSVDANGGIGSRSGLPGYCDNAEHSDVFEIASTTRRASSRGMSCVSDSNSLDVSYNASPTESDCTPRNPLPRTSLRIRKSMGSAWRRRAMYFVFARCSTAKYKTRNVLTDLRRWMRRPLRSTQGSHGKLERSLSTD